MELKEAIEHAEHKAADVSCCCREDHKQLAQWLKELADRRDKDKNLNLGEGTMELKDTIEIMTSEDYRERFKAEYYQLKIREHRLLTMLEKYERGELNFEPTCPVSVLWEQHEIMNSYLVILEKRAGIEGIELEGCSDVL